jgi:hypothetical protein
MSTLQGMRLSVTAKEACCQYWLGSARLLIRLSILFVSQRFNWIEVGGAVGWI